MKRKWFRRNWFKVLPLLLITAGFIWAVIILLAEDNWLAITALATLVLALGVFLTIRQTREIQKRERRDRLLNEIIEWAEDINNASLTPDISLISKVVELMKKERDVDVNIYIELLKKEREENVLMRYGNSLTKAISIETITSEGFKEQLLQDVEEVINTLAKFMCVKQFKLFGVMPSKKGFPETVIKETEKRINEGKISIDELWDEYANDLADSVRNLLIEANKIKAKDIN